MYIPNYYKNENLKEVKDFLLKNSFGILISTVEQKPWGTHTPLVLEIAPNGNEVLYGHISKANPQWEYFSKEAPVLAIFNGPHAYVSSSWYSHENVPTWNYIAVHVYGHLQILDKEETKYALKKLIDKYESTSTNPVRLENLSENTLRQINGIVAFKITIDEIQAAYKLSQNRTEADYKNVVNTLANLPDPLAKETARVMKTKR